MDKKPKKSPTQRQPRACALEMARSRPPFLNMEVSDGGAPARPRWCARATPFRNTQDKDLACPRVGVALEDENPETYGTVLITHSTDW
ncbi:hypothetical protein PIB30_070132 [Stylosanthes scabra]|uniref:Uncharacterized protein n=1 Tax=Stylosanthes scabra TaxID=79078 RepID=A0ABU6UP04_9FABA|nr:hypothetical protein [Stylosanthes scabra]